MAQLHSGPGAITREPSIGLDGVEKIHLFEEDPRNGAGSAFDSKASDRSARRHLIEQDTHVRRRLSRCGTY
jgi:hypothetical protein